MTFLTYLGGKMKVLHIDTYFLLPDDFDGDSNDAIRELLKYRESKKLSDFNYVSKDNKKFNTPWAELSDDEKWNRFYDLLIDGYKHVGAILFSEYDPKTKKWTKLG